MLRCSEVPDKSYENSQDHYAAVDCVEARASRCLLPPIGDKPNQPRNLSFPSSHTATETGPSSLGGLIAIRGFTTVNVRVLHFAITVSKQRQAT